MLAQGADSGGGADSAAADQAKTDSLYENRATSKKIIRVITVMAYMVSVSFVAIVLSGYYVFLWQPPNPRLLHTSKLEGIPGLDYPENHAPVSPSTEPSKHIDEGQKVAQNQGPKSTDRTNFNAESVLRKNESFSSDVRTFSTTWNAIFQASLRTQTPSSGNKTTNNSVYETVNNVSANNGQPVTSSALFIKNDEINEAANDSSASTISSEELNKFSEPSITEDVSNDEIHRDAHNSTENFSPTTSKRNQSFAETRDINDGQIVIAMPIETSENYEAAKYFTSGSRSFHPFREDQTTEKMENESRAQRETIQQPHELGSHIARVPITRFSTNVSLEELRREKNLPVQLSSRDSSPVESSTEEIEAPNGESALEPSPMIEQPDLMLPNEEKSETKDEHLSQEMNDFDFI